MERVSTCVTRGPLKKKKQQDMRLAEQERKKLTMMQLKYKESLMRQDKKRLLIRKRLTMMQLKYKESLMRQYEKDC